MKLVFASNNKNKIQEIRKQLPDSIEILSLEEIGCVVDIPETANTIEGNARLKADFIKRHYGYDCFADDSGLEIDALNGEPGVYSARYAGEMKDDERNIDKVLKNLTNLQNRQAQFKTVIVLHFQGETYEFTGIVRGEILSERKGNQGFGYDPIFQATGDNRSFAELTLEEKNSLSHRGKAVKQLLAFLSKQ